MMTADGPKVLEFNVRLGDPETQPLMHRISRETPFGGLADARRDGIAGRIDAAMESRALGVRGAGCRTVIPAQVRTGDVISGIESCGADVFQAGTKMGASGLETAGGRVLGVTASGINLAGAIANAYAGVETIHFEGMQYRGDIGRKGLKRWPRDTVLIHPFSPD